MNILTVDIGNSRQKTTVLCDGEPVYSVSGSKRSGVDAVEAAMSLNSVDGAVLCCVGEDPGRVGEWFAKECDCPKVVLQPCMPLPVRIDYETPGTLGMDRVAAAAGSMVLAAKREMETARILVVDAGTAITSDIVEEGCFKGGAISPGLRLRFESLDRHTGKLPLTDARDYLDESGKNTLSCIRKGVVEGAVLEIEGWWRDLAELPGGCGLMLTGGDAELLGKLLEARGVPIVLDSFLVARGLGEIYRYAMARGPEKGNREECNKG